MPQRITDTRQKALQVNFDTNIYGTFAEIGAGQEVSRNFFRAGGASGTIAKTMSAYDMTFSDKIYGIEDAGRYVAESRLKKMLRHEYGLLLKRLGRESEKRYFAFANTVATRRYKSKKEGYGWLGVRFRFNKQSKPNDVILHVKLKDMAGIQQQEALGILGVNLIYACYFLKDDPEVFVESLLDDLSRNRIEIAMVRMIGPDFDHIDNRLLALLLVQQDFTHAAMFNSKSQVVLPSEILYKKNILVLRGSFRPPTLVTMDMQRLGSKAFREEADVIEEKIVEISELTLTNLMLDGEIDVQDYLYRVEIMCSLGHTVMISNFHEHYKLVKYLSGISKFKKGLILGVPNLYEMFETTQYSDLPGGILEAFGTLFGRNVKIFLYPMQPNPEDELVNSQNANIDEDVKHLYEYVLQKGRIQDLTGFKQKVLPIFSKDVLKKIRNNEEGWEKQVPTKVARVIKEKCLFDYPGEA